MTIRFTEEALDDLNRLRGFLLTAVDEPLANRITNQLVGSLQTLSAHPEKGVVVKRMSVNRSVRDLFVHNYCVRYRLSHNEIIILRLWHQRENERNH